MRRWLPLLALLLTPLLAYRLGRETSHDAAPRVAPPAAATPESEAAADAPNSVRAGAPPPSRAPAVLPTTGLPLTQNLDALERAARDGDHAALLRVSRELGRCFDYSFRQRELAMMEANVAALEPRAGADDAHSPHLIVQRGDNGTVNGIQVEDSSPLRLQKRALERLRERSDQEFGSAREDCAGLSREQLGRAFDWELRAARSGDRDAMLAFVTEPWFNGNRAAAELDKLETYVAEGPGMLDRLVASGHPGGLWLAAQAYADSERETEPGQLVKPDPVRAYAMALRYLASADPTHRDDANQLVARLLEEITPEQAARTQAEVAKGG